MLFDIDGALLDDGGAAGASFNSAFMEIFSVHPKEVYKHGKTDPLISKEIGHATLGRDLTEEEIAVLDKRYTELLPYYLEEKDSLRVFPGVERILQKLRLKARCSLGLQTGNLEPCAHAKLAKANIAEYFTFGGFGSDSGERADIIKVAIQRGSANTGYSPEKDFVFVIGDSPFDMNAGNKNEAITIGVATGRSSVEELKSAGAAAVLQSFEEIDCIEDFVEELRGTPYER